MKSLAEEILFPDMVLISGGAFVMGGAEGRDDEIPPHIVEISPFWIARYAVTNREYAVFLRETGATEPPASEEPRFNHPDQPIVAVNWFEAAAYCAWLSERTGEAYRLPTEAEREMACRAGTQTAYPWGDTPERELGDYGRRWYEGGPEIAGGPSNAFGLCNMADNVHEWCLDWYSKSYYNVSPVRDPGGPATGVRRASRGGSWRHQIKVTRSAARSSLDPSFRYTDYGFRVVRRP